MATYPVPPVQAEEIRERLKAKLLEHGIDPALVRDGSVELQGGSSSQITAELIIPLTSAEAAAIVNGE